MIHVGDKEFEDQVLKSDVPVVVDFYADWCGPCRMVGPLMEQLSDEYSGKAKFVKVDTDSNPELTSKYGIMSIPTVMVFKNGTVKDTVIGVAPAPVYRQKIEGTLRA
ncbi:MAG: thioredoxin [Thaumarchaeota archaeon]|nr:thioredoxin [Nitrososphaerota archaeon]